MIWGSVFRVYGNVREAQSCALSLPHNGPAEEYWCSLGRHDAAEEVLDSKSR